MTETRTPNNAPPCIIRKRHTVVKGSKVLWCKWCKMWLGDLKDEEVRKWLREHPQKASDEENWYREHLSQVYSLDCVSDAPPREPGNTATQTAHPAWNAHSTNTMTTKTISDLRKAFRSSK